MQHDNTGNQGTHLFESIFINNAESFEKFLESLGFEQSVFVISKAIEFSHSRGIYNMDEAELLNKCIRILNKSAFNYESSDQDRTNIKNN